MSQIKGKKRKKGFSLIELLVAMFIFVLVMGAMVSVSVSGFRSYSKSKAIKTVTEDIGFAMNSIAKDVRMGKIEDSAYADGTAQDYLFITRNRDQMKVCYKITSTSLEIQEGATDCSLGNYNKIVDLYSTGMEFNSGPTGTAKFLSCITDKVGDGRACNGVVGKRRGWVEMNLNVGEPSMETDEISVQTIVSSRDYGWDE